MTKEELESKFEDCFDANTRSSEGGYGPDVTDRLGMWRSFAPIVDEFTKQQAIAFARFINSKFELHGDNYVKKGHFDNEVYFTDEVYSQFIEQQSKEK